MGFHLFKGLFEPLQLTARVISEFHQKVIAVVTSLCINSYNSDFFVDSAVTCFEFLRVETIDSVLFLCVICQPYFPQIKVVGDHWVSYCEVLRIDCLPEVVVAFNWVSCPV